LACLLKHPILGNLVPGTPYYVDTIGLIGGTTTAHDLSIQVDMF